MQVVHPLTSCISLTNIFTTFPALNLIRACLTINNLKSFSEIDDDNNNKKKQSNLCFHQEQTRISQAGR